ncbi:serine acetyltransferase [Bacillaceae bacterium Marseille-Q3522]|nr:serine acetyltransferase [Bacillaceae bacterium Marseille-Q3522]
MNKWFLDMRANDTLNGRIVMTVFRFGNWLYYRFKIPVVRQLLWIIYIFLDTIVVRGYCGTDIPPSAKIGGGLYLAHGGKGVIMHETTVIGEKVTILQQVTLGENSHHKIYPDRGPAVGNNVYIGAGAKLIGKIEVGDHAIIGANAVVLTDVPPIARAVGIPAKIIESNEIIYSRHSPSARLKDK